MSDYEILGRPVSLPVRVRNAAAAVATWLVPAEPAARWLPPGLRPAAVLPGRTLLSIGCLDYRENDLGRYRELQISLFVREAGEPAGLPGRDALAFLRGTLPTWIQHLPVDDAFSCEAGCRVWGFPKTVDELEIEELARRVRCRWRQRGQLVLEIELPRGGRMRVPERAMHAYTLKGGALHRTPFTTGAEQVGFRPGGVRLALGEHPVADELRALGLPRRALGSVWMGQMHGRFDAPEKR